MSSKEKNSYLWPHVFSCVDADTCNAEIDQIVQVTSYGIPYVIESSVKIGQTDQIAISNDFGISVIINTACYVRES